MPAAMNRSGQPSALRSPALGPHGHPVSTLAASDSSLNRPPPWLVKSALPRTWLPSVARNRGGNMVFGSCFLRLVFRPQVARHVRVHVRDEEIEQTVAVPIEDLTPMAPHGVAGKTWRPRF